ncbi:hypothetical protein COU59_01705 [Candidatus Pacearchaeota archaeon CG10_big_fil_rev_8_21_14_0_10_34_12]|nr:MAG: hypothetical protein COU59_01705 [Candidatus Pacearchaeota archaeon CG10_big_fil_rev_8_21_14_0_10_34_12]
MIKSTMTRQSERIRKGLMTIIARELRELKEKFQEGKTFNSETYFDALRLAQKYLPERDIEKCRKLYRLIVGKYWKNKK